MTYPPVSAIPSLSYDTLLVDCGDGNGLTVCPCIIPECHWRPPHPENYDGNDSVQSMLDEDGLVEIGRMRQDFSLTHLPQYYTDNLPSTPTEVEPATLETSWPTGGVIIKCLGENGGLTWCPQSYTNEALSMQSEPDAAALQTPSPMRQTALTL